jgi:hypothetical protein
MPELTFSVDNATTLSAKDARDVPCGCEINFQPAEVS